MQRIQINLEVTLILRVPKQLTSQHFKLQVEDSVKLWPTPLELFPLVDLLREQERRSLASRYLPGSPHTQDLVPRSEQLPQIQGVGLAEQKLAERSAGPLVRFRLSEEDYSAGL